MKSLFFDNLSTTFRGRFEDVSRTFRNYVIDFVYNSYFGLNFFPYAQACLRKNLTRDMKKNTFCFCARGKNQAKNRVINEINDIVSKRPRKVVERLSKA